MASKGHGDHVSTEIEIERQKPFILNLVIPSFHCKAIKLPL